MPINLVNAVVRVKVERIGLRLTLIGRDIRSFSRGLVVNASPGDIQPRQGCSQDFSKAGSQRLLTRLSCRPMSTSTRAEVYTAALPPVLSRHEGPY